MGARAFLSRTLSALKPQAGVCAPRADALPCTRRAKAEPLSWLCQCAGSLGWAAQARGPHSFLLHLTLPLCTQGCSLLPPKYPLGLVPPLHGRGGEKPCEWLHAAAVLSLVRAFRRSTFPSGRQSQAKGFCLQHSLRPQHRPLAVRAEELGTWVAPGFHKELERGSNTSQGSFLLGSQMPSGTDLSRDRGHRVSELLTAHKPTKT